LRNATPIPAKPRSIIAQVAGSGTEGVGGVTMGGVTTGGVEPPGGMMKPPPGGGRKNPGGPEGGAVIGGTSKASSPGTVTGKGEVTKSTSGGVRSGTAIGTSGTGLCFLTRGRARWRTTCFLCLSCTRRPVGRTPGERWFNRSSTETACFATLAARVDPPSCGTGSSTAAPASKAAIAASTSFRFWPGVLSERCLITLA
jgi:hypothetical protein